MAIISNGESGASVRSKLNADMALMDARSITGYNIFTVPNPGAITFLRINADNSVSTRTTSQYRGDLGATTIGDNLFTLTNPSAVTFPRFNADNTVSARTAAQMRADLGSTTVGDNLFTLPNPSAIRFLRINADNTVTPRTAAEIAVDIFPQTAWTTHNSTIGGFTGTPTQSVTYFRIGNLVTVSVNITGTSNATTFTFTLPFNAVGLRTTTGQSTNNGTKTTGAVQTTAGSNVVNVFTTLAEGAFTNSGTKALNHTFTYECQ